MRPSRISLILSCLVVASAISHGQTASVPNVPGLPPSARTAAESIDPLKIRAHVRFLSLDLLEGRARARAEQNWPPNTSPRSSRWPGSSLQATTAPTSSRSRSSPCTPMRTRPNSLSCPRAARRSISPMERRSLPRMRPARPPQTSMRRSFSSATAFTRPSTTGTTSRARRQGD